MNVILLVGLGIIAAVLIGGVVLFTQVPRFNTFVQDIIAKNSGKTAWGPQTAEEQLAADAQTLREKQVELDWRKYCAANKIDDSKCSSLWAEQQSLNAAKQDLAEQQAAIREQQESAAKLEAEREAAAKKLAADQEAARLQALDDEKEAARQAAAAQKAAYLKELATPKAGYIELTKATLDPSGVSSVTIHNLLPNTCGGSNFCDIVVIDKVFVNGVQTKWSRASQDFIILAGEQRSTGKDWSHSTMPFVNKSYDSGTIRVEGYSKDDSQRIFAEYRV